MGGCRQTRQWVSGPRVGGAVWRTGAEGCAVAAETGLQLTRQGLPGHGLAHTGLRATTFPGTAPDPSAPAPWVTNVHPETSQPLSPGARPRSLSQLAAGGAHLWFWGAPSMAELQGLGRSGASHCPWSARSPWPVALLPYAVLTSRNRPCLLRSLQSQDHLPLRPGKVGLCGRRAPRRRRTFGSLWQKQQVVAGLAPC